LWLGPCSRSRKEKATAQAEYNKSHKEVRQSVRKDWITYIENLAAQAEEAANMRNMKDLYDTTKKLGRLRFIFNSSSALLISGVTSGGGLFSSLKCSAHLASCSSQTYFTRSTGTYGKTK
jgi:hypothetical protein